jgi:hypothetical protein
MAKFANVTISGKIGPGYSVTSLVFTDVTAISFEIKNNTIDIFQDTKTPRHTTFDYNATATVTYTISGSTATITIS